MVRPWVLPGPRHRGPLTLTSFLTGNKEGSKGIMVLPVRPTRTRFPANIPCILYQVCAIRVALWKPRRWAAIAYNR